MEIFQIIQPSIILAPCIKHYWFLQTNSASQTIQRTISTGFICLMFHRGDRIFSAKNKDWHPYAFLSGQEMAHSDLVYSGNIDMIVVVFKPFGAKAFFKMPMNELKEQHISIYDLSNPQLTELQQRLMEIHDNLACVKMIEQFLLKNIHNLPNYNFKRMTAVINSINLGEYNIDALAQTACLSYKQFKRIFAEYIGANPKDYLRIIRFQKALHELQLKPKMSLTELAYKCNFYDQSHLIKEFKAFSGYTPSEYISICPPYSDYFSHQ